MLGQLVVELSKMKIFQLNHWSPYEQPHNILLPVHHTLYDFQQF